jgi:hypothetical protein
MRETTHTAGPWTVRATLLGGALGYSFKVDMPNGTTLLQCGGHENQEANARLIAAAPELLEALDYFHQFAELNDDGEDEKFTTMLKKARAAIAKAKGGAP